MLADAYMHCYADTSGEWHAVGAALSGSEEMGAVHQELLDVYVALFAAALKPHSALQARPAAASALRRTDRRRRGAIGGDGARRGDGETGGEGVGGIDARQPGARVMKSTIRRATRRNPAGRPTRPQGIGGHPGRPNLPGEVQPLRACTGASPDASVRARSPSKRRGRCAPSHARPTVGEPDRWRPGPRPALGLDRRAPHPMTASDREPPDDRGSARDRRHRDRCRARTARRRPALNGECSSTPTQT